MTGTRARALLARYAVATLYLAGYLLTGLVYAALPAAVGHATALVAGAVAGGLLLWQRRAPRTQPAGPDPLT